MKKNPKTFLLLLLIAPVLLISSCTKDTAQKANGDLSATKLGWVTGTWKQTDIQLAYPIPNPLGGDDLPVGTSLHLLSDYLPVTGPLIEATNDNVFSFDAKGTYNITGTTDYMLPNAAATGNWNLQVYGSALHLVSGDKDTPLWIDKISATDMRLGSLSNTIYVAEVDADLPVYYVFQKQ
ncbi:MAG: hypothetical protein QM802_23825 [Agriterribacter sp.]